MKISEKELLQIKDLAIRSGIDLCSRSLYQNSELFQAYVYAKAMILFLNKNRLLIEDVDLDERIDPKYRKD